MYILSSGQVLKSLYVPPWTSSGRIGIEQMICAENQRVIYEHGRAWFNTDSVIWSHYRLSWLCCSLLIILGSMCELHPHDTIGYEPFNTLDIPTDLLCYCCILHFISRATYIINTGKSWCCEMLASNVFEHVWSSAYIKSPMLFKPIAKSIVTPVQSVRYCFVLNI